jgi:hypothetical protein
VGFLWGRHLDGGLVEVLWGSQLSIPPPLAGGPDHLQSPNNPLAWAREQRLEVSDGSQTR